ncbi:putative sugar phosphate/phosphate translocator isoform X2 [Gossypium australe]|uniref:Putative sugar phosphate/phosphate translocator isoform X2 n=1 Tax=Gossypium australe TaxID=47621 RepID=A0A5B6W7I9_9ROSI|nr:putative sugar phosphate/phosphate translocator isoform X2 [Gossypium australe]
MGKGGSLSDGVIKKILLSYTYVAIWIFLSFTVIVYNKYILDKKMYNWPFPISLTMIHMSFCASLAFLLIKVFKVVEPVSMSRDLYLSSVVPIGALYSLSLWLSNSAYIYLSVSFIQMLKALMPVAVYSIGVLFKKEGYKNDTMVNMLSISFGVAIAAYGEAKFDTWGVILQLGAVAFEATSCVLTCWKDLCFDHECSWGCQGLVVDCLLLDTVTPINLFGYGLAFLGVAYYNHSKLQALKAKEAQKKTAQADEEGGRLLEEREGEGSGKSSESQD